MITSSRDFKLSRRIVLATGFAGLFAMPACSTFAVGGPQWPAIDPKLPTLWIIGDSTIRNGTLGDGSNGQWGWGNPIAEYFDKSKINIQNRALGGTSSRTYMTNSGQASWTTVLPLIKSGDFLIMQFGHNDGGAVNDATRARATIKNNSEETQEIENLLTKKHEVVHSYGWYLRKYCTDAKEKGAIYSMICSPIPRNNWRGNTIAPDSYGPIAQEAAKQIGAGFIDLNGRIIKKYTELGQAKVTADLFPAGETTHTDWAGAVLNAELVIEGMKALPECPVVKYLLPQPPKDLKNPTGKPK